MTTQSTIARPGTLPTRDIEPAGFSRRGAALIAGIGYVLLFLLAIFANFYVVEGLVVAGDANATVANLTESLGLFRWGMVAFLAVFVLDIVIAWALHVVFRTVDHDVSLIAAWSRLVYTVFLGVALVFFFEVLQLLGGASYLETVGSGQLAAQVMIALESFNATWLVGLVAFGLHLALLGTLLIRSRMVSRALGILLIIAGASYVVDTVAHAVLPSYENFSGLFLALVAIPSMIGEGWLGLWLLFKAGRR